MKTLYSGEIYCHYHWAYIAEAGLGGSQLCWVGQRNGLCGSAAPNEIAFTFGPHTSMVNFQILFATDPPLIDPRWEEVVETPFVVERSSTFYLTDFNGDPYGDPMPLAAGTYRLRFSAINYNLTEQVPPTVSDEYGVMPSALADERYELVIWPSPAYPDAVIKATTSDAKSWHRFRQDDLVSET